MGEPEEIVAAQLPSGAPLVSNAKGVHEWAAIILLLIGGFFFGVGWLVGLILLWSSRAWNAVDKLIGTFVLPGGLSAVLFALVLGGSGETCLSGPGQRTICAGAPEPPRAATRPCANPPTGQTRQNARFTQAFRAPNGRLDLNVDPGPHRATL